MTIGVSIFMQIYILIDRTERMEPESIGIALMNIKYYNRQITWNILYIFAYYVLFALSRIFKFS